MSAEEYAQREATVAIFSAGLRAQWQGFTAAVFDAVKRWDAGRAAIEQRVNAALAATIRPDGKRPPSFPEPDVRGITMRLRVLYSVAKSGDDDGIGLLKVNDPAKLCGELEQAATELKAQSVLLKRLRHEPTTAAPTNSTEEPPPPLPDPAPLPPPAAAAPIVQPSPPINDGYRPSSWFRREGRNVPAYRLRQAVADDRLKSIPGRPKRYCVAQAEELWPDDMGVPHPSAHRRA